ncbi:MAG: hypothetical protein U0470_09655 [Anaerolineae bacterium]
MSVTMVGDVRSDERLPVILKLRPGFIARGELRALSDVAPSQSYRMLAAQATGGPRPPRSRR